MRDLRTYAGCFRGHVSRYHDKTGLECDAVMVLTAVGDYVYRRKKDGIIVCPISALKP